MAESARPLDSTAASPLRGLRRLAVSPVQIDTVAAKRKYMRFAGWAMRRIAHVGELTARHRLAEQDGATTEILLARTPPGIRDQDNVDFAAGAIDKGRGGLDGKPESGMSPPQTVVPIAPSPSGLASHLQRRSLGSGLLMRSPARSVIAQTSAVSLHEGLHERLTQRATVTLLPATPVAIGVRGEERAMYDGNAGPPGSTVAFADAPPVMRALSGSSDVAVSRAAIDPTPPPASASGPQAQVIANTSRDPFHGRLTPMMARRKFGAANGSSREAIATAPDGNGERHPIVSSRADATVSRQTALPTSTAPLRAAMLPLVRPAAVAVRPWTSNAVTRSGGDSAPAGGVTTSTAALARFSIVPAKDATLTHALPPPVPVTVVTPVTHILRSTAPATNAASAARIATGGIAEPGSAARTERRPVAAMPVGVLEPSRFALEVATASVPTALRHRPSHPTGMSAAAVKRSIDPAAAPVPVVAPSSPAAIEKNASIGSPLIWRTAPVADGGRSSVLREAEVRSDAVGIGDADSAAGAMPRMSHSGPSPMPGGTATGTVAPVPDTNRLVDEVVRRVVRRIHIERERRGGNLWN